MRRGSEAQAGRAGVRAGGEGAGAEGAGRWCVAKMARVPGSAPRAMPNAGSVLPRSHGGRGPIRQGV